MAEDGFIPSSHSVGREVQQMLLARPDIRALIGPAEEATLAEVFAALERAVIWNEALSKILHGDPDAAGVATQAFIRSGNITAVARPMKRVHA